MKKSNSYAVVTGASSGIGKAFARRLSAEGYGLVLVARRTEELEKLADELGGTGIKTVIVNTDLSSISGCDKLLREIQDLNISIFVNNAGFGDCGLFAKQDVWKELAMIDVNIKALHYLTKAMLLKMEKSGHGYILNVASSAGLLPAGPYMATYYATKAYVASMTRAIARELSEQKSRIYVGCLCPGPVDTEFNSVANVKFALKGISASYCADYAVDMMMKRKVVIVPTLRMKLAVWGSRFVPDSILIGITSRQQKKKIYG